MIGETPALLRTDRRDHLVAETGEQGSDPSAARGLGIDEKDGGARRHCSLNSYKIADKHNVSMPGDASSINLFGPEAQGALLDRELGDDRQVIAGHASDLQAAGVGREQP